MPRNRCVGATFKATLCGHSGESAYRCLANDACLLNHQTNSTLDTCGTGTCHRINWDTPHLMRKWNVNAKWSPMPGAGLSLSHCNFHRIAKPLAAIRFSANWPFQHGHQQGPPANRIASLCAQMMNSPLSQPPPHALYRARIREARGMRQFMPRVHAHPPPPSSRPAPARSAPRKRATPITMPQPPSSRAAPSARSPKPSPLSPP